MTLRKRTTLAAVGMLGAAAAMATTTFPVLASSHREAPLITEDPVADLTDVYAFVSPDDPNSTTLVLNVNPMSEPGGGPNFHKFGDDVLYQVNIDNNGDAVQDISYQFRFKTTYQNPNTFLYNTGPVNSLTDANLNVRQTYTVTEVRGATSTEVASNLRVAPPNIGPRSTPNYEALASASVASIAGGRKVFAGPRDDPFFADLGAIFDLGGLRPFNAAHLLPLEAAPGVDYVAGYNVHSIVLQVPNSLLRSADDPVIGIWATTSRRAQRVLTGNGVLQHNGDWVQVSRLGMPLVNEVVVPVGTKDYFNASQPKDDLQFAAAVLKPELAGLIPVLYPGVKVPTEVSAGLGLGGREDVATIFLTGIPNVNKPKNVKPAEMLRLNTSVAKSGFPNGRLLNDDVVDVSLQVLAGATAFSPTFNVAPNNQLTDGVPANDKAFTGSFPYVAHPSQGYSANAPKVDPFAPPNVYIYNNPTPRPDPYAPAVRAK